MRDPSRRKFTMSQHLLVYHKLFLFNTHKSAFTLERGGGMMAAPLFVCIQWQYTDTHRVVLLPLFDLTIDHQLTTRGSREVIFTGGGHPERVHKVNEWGTDVRSMFVFVSKKEKKLVNFCLSYRFTFIVFLMWPCFLLLHSTIVLDVVVVVIAASRPTCYYAIDYRLFWVTLYKNPHRIGQQDRYIPLAISYK